MERSESGITMRGKTGDAMDRPGWRSSFLGDPGATFLCGKLGRGTKKEKSSKKERTEGLWKLTLLMEIRKGRGFPQPLEKRLAKDARLFHSSHRPNNKDLFTIIYCRHDQKPWNGMCANSKLSQQRGSPQTPSGCFVPSVSSYSQRRCLVRPSDYLRTEISRFDIWLGSQSDGECAAVDGQCREDDGFDNRFVLKSPYPQCLKVFRAHRQAVSAQLKAEFEQCQIGHRETSVLVVVH